jgi:hypothetical protein
VTWALVLRGVLWRGRRPDFWGTLMKSILAAKPLLTSTLAGAAMLALACGASAKTFNWSYVGTNGYSVSASGTLTATPLGGGAFQVTSMTGMRDGSPVDGTADYAFEDNVVYTTDPHLDYPGLAFTVGSDAFNVYFDTETTDAYACGAVGYCEIGPGVVGTSGLGPPVDPVHTINFSLSAAPEPASWAIMLIGTFGLGAALRRRRAPVSV